MRSCQMMIERSAGSQPIRFRSKDDDSCLFPSEAERRKRLLHSPTTAAVREESLRLQKHKNMIYCNGM